MKYVFVTLLSLLSLNAVGQQIADKFDVHTWTPPYALSTPPGWTTERFPIPIVFAPQIPYKGVEDLRFMPGWSKQTQEDYWSYVFLWWLEGNPTITAASLQANLTAYYSGLLTQNTDRNRPIVKKIPTVAVIKKIKTTANEDPRYGGTITMLDYMSQRAITLNCFIYVKRCKEQNRMGIFFELSPQPAGHAVWSRLHSIQSSFLCRKK